MPQYQDIEGIDAAEGIRRTGDSPALYFRFLKRFPDDPSFHKLLTSLQGSDMRQAFTHAHTLKGLSAQLAIHALHTPLTELCDMLRNDDPQALPHALACLRAMTPVYLEIVARIHALC